MTKCRTMPVAVTAAPIAVDAGPPSDAPLFGAELTEAALALHAELTRRGVPLPCDAQSLARSGRKGRRAFLTKFG